MHCIASTGAVDPEESEEKDGSTSSATASQHTVKFEEAEMPPLYFITDASDGLFHCPYHGCQWTTAWDQRHGVRY
jgi:hypothetical protein